MIAARNIGLWFLSVLLSVGLFSLVLSGGNGPASARLFRITMKLALPVAFLFLPIVITKREMQRKAGG